MTTPYDIKIGYTAYQQILQLSSKYQKLILRVIEALSVNPRPPGTEKIEGVTGLYCESIENLRVIYKVEDQEIIVLLVKPN